jgi:hypothetical protein
MTIEYPGVAGHGQIYLDVVRAICGDTAGKSMVDLMCHRAPYTPMLGFEQRTYVDIQDRQFDFEEEKQYFICSDVLEFLKYVPGRKYDVAICSDGIEHLTIVDGFTLLIRMRYNATKSIIFTPLGEYNLNAEDTPDAHQSGWLPSNLSDDYAKIIFPDFHPSLNVGAFFAFNCDNTEQEFERIKNELKNKSWAQLQ